MEIICSNRLISIIAEVVAIASDRNLLHIKETGGSFKVLLQTSHEWTQFVLKNIDLRTNYVGTFTVLSVGRESCEAQ